MRLEETEVSPLRGGRFKNQKNLGRNAAQIVLKMDSGSQTLGKGIISVSLNAQMMHEYAKTRALSKMALLTGHKRVGTCIMPSTIEKHSSLKRVRTLKNV